MGVGISLGNLAGAVAREGGVGVISTANVGFRETDFWSNTAAANLSGCDSSKLGWYRGLENNRP